MKFKLVSTSTLASCQIHECAQAETYSKVQPQVSKIDDPNDFKRQLYSLV